MKKLFQKLPDPFLRLLAVFAAIAGMVLLVRWMIPSSLRDTDEHMRVTIEAETAHPLRYAGSQVCGDCHEEAAIKRAGYHRNLSCETCHGPAMAHAEDPTGVTPEAPRRREFCSHCHIYNPARPTGFPQINPAVHNPLKQCVACHNPHDPRPSEVPRECEACHAGIARTKAVSPHVQLACTTCHTVPAQHRIAPHQVRAGIPSDREFCAKCHDISAQVRETPKVDFAVHGEKYVCWDCHYPHMPEVH